MILAVWLIAKGFDPSVIAAEYCRQHVATPDHRER